MASENGDDEREFLTLEQVEAMLPEGERVHTFRSGPGLMLGTDWDRADILKHCKEFQPEVAGEMATRMGHGVVVTDKTGPLFIETKKPVTSA